MHTYAFGHVLGRILSSQKKTHHVNGLKKAPCQKVNFVIDECMDLIGTIISPDELQSSQFSGKPPQVSYPNPHI